MPPVQVNSEMLVFYISLFPHPNIAFPNVIKQKGGMQGLKTVNREANIKRCFLAEGIFDAWREGKGECTGGIPQCMLRMHESRSRQSKARKDRGRYGHIKDGWRNSPTIFDISSSP
jgi:hypothetical protein